MSSVEYVIDANTKLFNTSYAVMQFSVSNVSIWDIYIKLNGATPAVNDYDYVVQANSDFVSGIINANTFSIYTAAETFVNPAKIKVSSTKFAEPSNTPYYPSRTIGGVNGYPYTTDLRLLSGALGGLPNGGGNVLPSIKFDNLIPVYLIVKTNSFNLRRPFLFMFGFFPTSDYGVIGSVNPLMGDTIIILNPNDMNNANQLYFYSLNTGYTSVDTLTISAYFSNSNIFRNRVGKFAPIRLTATGLATSYGYVKAPAFYYGLTVSSLNGGNVTTTFTITITLNDFVTRQTETIYTATFTGIVVNGTTGTILIPNTLKLVEDYKEIQISINMTSLTNSLKFKFGVWDYEN